MKSLHLNTSSFRAEPNLSVRSYWRSRTAGFHSGIRIGVTIIGNKNIDRAISFFFVLLFPFFDKSVAFLLMDSKDSSILQGALLGT